MTEHPEKVYLSCIDSNIDLDVAAVISQPIQHLAISAYARSIGGSIRFYTAEDALTRESQSLMRFTLRKRPQIDGIVFYRMKQFLYGERLNLEFLQTILECGYEVHFAREIFCIRDLQELERRYVELFCFEVIALGCGRDALGGT